MTAARWLCALALLLCGCTSTDDDADPPSAVSTPSSEGSCKNRYWEESLLASEPLYTVQAADHVAEFTVTSTTSGEVVATVRADVDAVDWSRPGAPALPREVDVTVFACQMGFDWHEGHTYLAPLTWMPGESEWWVVGHDGHLLYDDGILDNLDRNSWDAWADELEGKDADAYVSALEAAQASYSAFLEEAWRQPLPSRRHGYKWVHDPGQRADPGTQRSQARLARQLRAADPGLDITWRGRVLRQRLENSRIGEVTLGAASARATWGEDFPKGAEVHRARIDGREVWVLRCPNAMRLNRTLIVVIAPDGWWMKVRVPRA